MRESEKNLIPDLELLDSLSTHYHVPISKKIHSEKLIWSHSMFLSLLNVPQVNSAHLEAELASVLTYRTVQIVFALSN